MSSLLADSIFIFHALVILFFIIGPFTHIPALLILHVTFGLSLLVHWRLNSNMCSLSILESQLRGLDRTHTFTHQLVAPLYEISENEWNLLIYVITISLMGISLYNLYYSEKFQKFLQNQNLETIESLFRFD
jgi:small neutral amino acid transporter SnatA (MarC family)